MSDISPPLVNTSKPQQTVSTDSSVSPTTQPPDVPAAPAQQNKSKKKKRIISILLVAVIAIFLVKSFVNWIHSPARLYSAKSTQVTAAEQMASQFVQAKEKEIDNNLTTNVDKIRMDGPAVLQLCKSDRICSADDIAKAKAGVQGKLNAESNWIVEDQCIAKSKHYSTAGGSFSFNIVSGTLKDMNCHYASYKVYSWTGTEIERDELGDKSITSNGDWRVEFPWTPPGTVATEDKNHNISVDDPYHYYMDADMPGTKNSDFLVNKTGGWDIKWLKNNHLDKDPDFKAIFDKYPKGTLFFRVNVSDFYYIFYGDSL